MARERNQTNSDQLVDESANRPLASFDEAQAMAIADKGVDEKETLRRRIAQLESQMQQAEKNRVEGADARYVILATVPNMRVKVEFFFPPFLSVSTQGQKEMVSRPCSVFLCAGKTDPRRKNAIYAETLWEYPEDPKTGYSEPIMFRYMTSIAEIHSKMGIVLWDRNHETKDEAMLRGLTNYLNYVIDLKIKLQNRHLNMAMQGKEIEAQIPKQDTWWRQYPMQMYHFNNQTKIEKAIKQLEKKIEDAQIQAASDTQVRAS